jgi:chromosome segregation ATPase
MDLSDDICDVQDDIVTSLRSEMAAICVAVGRSTTNGFDTDWFDMAQSVRDRIAAITAERDALDKALAQCRGLLKQEVEDVTPLREKVKKLKAERDALAERVRDKQAVIDHVQKEMEGWAHEAGVNYKAALLSQQRVRELEDDLAAHENGLANAH